MYLQSIALNIHFSAPASKVRELEYDKQPRALCRFMVLGQFYSRYQSFQRVVLRELEDVMKSQWLRMFETSHTVLF